MALDNRTVGAAILLAPDEHDVVADRDVAVHDREDSIERSLKLYDENVEMPTSWSSTVTRSYGQVA